MLTAVKAVTTKKGDRMAIITIEDLTGHSEAVVFPKSFERIGHLIVPDARLMMWGKVDRRDDQVQFIIEDAEKIEDVHMVMVELEPSKANDSQEQYRLRQILQEQRGEDHSAKISVVAIVSAHNRRHFVRFGQKFRVQNEQDTVTALEKEGFRARVSSLVSA